MLDCDYRHSVSTHEIMLIRIEIANYSHVLNWFRTNPTAKIFEKHLEVVVNSESAPESRNGVQF